AHDAVIGKGLGEGLADHFLAQPVGLRHQVAGVAFELHPRLAPVFLLNAGGPLGRLYGHLQKMCHACDAPFLIPSAPTGSMSSLPLPRPQGYPSGFRRCWANRRFTSAGKRGMLVTTGYQPVRDRHSRGGPCSWPTSSPNRVSVRRTLPA